MLVNTASALATAATVSRTGTGETAGSYAGGLTVAGGTANNYNITRVAGDFTIVPADQLLVKVAPSSATFGTAAGYNVSSAKYLLSAAGTGTVEATGTTTLTGSGTSFTTQLQVGDVILSLDGKPIIMSADLPHLVGALKPGTSAELDVVRDGARKKLKLSIGALPEDGEALAGTAEPGVERSSNRLGVKVVELTAEQQKSLDLKGGVAISEVQDGPAALIGLRPGDVITHLNNQAINSAKTFTEVAQALPKNRSVSMRVLRQGRASFITFKLAD